MSVSWWNFSFCLNGIDWSVQFVDKLPEEPKNSDTDGLTFPKKQEIYVLRGNSDTHTWRVLWHEITHACLDAASTSFITVPSIVPMEPEQAYISDEVVCDNVPSMMLQLLQQRSKLPEFLFQPPQQQKPPRTRIRRSSRNQVTQEGNSDGVQQVPNS